MKTENKLILFFILLFVSPLLFYAYDDVRDSRNTAKEVCEDMNLTRLDQNIIVKKIPRSNVSNDRYYTKSIYKVECSDGVVYDYKPYRTIEWNIVDCNNRNKWDECTSIFPERNKYVGYTK